ncbi:PhnD/SsuA/transferrin family substrate-binding protein [Enterococcus sp. MJM12]|uniref:PhnD/SsuA/transferrin family substrate-binding protein n=1 Tax=Candidatus Enterococcus myersii TaxID=2815322 RepID=A0ABS3H6Y4_9ENTE|nr:MULTISPECIES: phosphate/phosphite/phosphonate ABC transporter substrate-binding protein [Enterococcus]MBO0449217.1 PhnD/SsuA/transferrin family substrate-binding protein [Enterococcus sp. MJM12]MCD1025312.1 phosphate/phosphite/phosphonate ABC transporter substrate-binding protein [Enterococcus sp. SMC-9]WHA09512.1 phosphate/phosphite/phosphonate ABC transporter substrate-binding protein [Enterococcus montenegrensis]
MFKKVLKVGLASAAAMLLLAGCGNSSSNDSKGEKDADGNIKLEKLTIGFVPSRDADEIVTATEPLKNLLKDQMKKEGYNIENVDISVGTSYEAVGESLSSGTLDVGFIPGGTYVLYEDGTDVLLTATRKGLSIDSDDAKVWNDEKPTKNTDEQVAYYRALIIAGPSAKGQALAKKVNAGEKLTWNDLNSASWAMANSSSSAGYIYPTLWMNKNYDKTLLDLKDAVQSDSYASSFARLAAGQIDVVMAYADARLDYVDTWTKEFGRKNDIWSETNVIGVTDPIYNDTISVSKNAPNMDAKLKKALSKAFIEIGKTDEGKKVISIYNHEGYKEAKASDYDDEKKAQELIKKISE